MEIILQQTIINQMKNWIQQAGTMIRQEMYHPLTINIKSNPNDLVTEMDRKVELFFVDKIRRYYPEHQIVTEEGYGDDNATTEGFVWLIDPIDGTMNFVHQKKNFAISIALYENGVGKVGMIYNVMAQKLYVGIEDEGAFVNQEPMAFLERKRDLSKSIVSLNHKWLTQNKLANEKKMQKLVRAVRGTRTYGSATLELMLLAEGATDVYLSMRLSPWDFGAGKIILHEVGGVLKKISGNALEMLDTAPVIAGNQHLVETVIQNYLQD